jgi:hypothetical protein
MASAPAAVVVAGRDRLLAHRNVARSSRGTAKAVDEALAQPSQLPTVAGQVSATRRSTTYRSAAR